MTIPRPFQILWRRFGDFLLFAVTVTELTLLLLLTPTFSAADWVYLLQHLIVLGIALRRSLPRAWDHSAPSNLAVGVAYLYSYAQIICLRFWPGNVTAPTGGLILVTLAAGLSLFSLLTIGTRFGVRPALRDLATKGPYRLVRHPMYLSYIIADIGYNLQEWSWITLLLVLSGWASLIYRIRAEDRILSQHNEWPAYAKRVKYRLVPFVW